MTNKTNAGAPHNEGRNSSIGVRFVDDTPKPTIDPPSPVTEYYGGIGHEFTFRQRADILKRQYENVWARYHKRTIVEPFTHYPNSYQSVICCDCDLLANRPPLDVFAGAAAKFDNPLYYVSQSLYDAIKHTHPPANMNWNDVLFPYPALTFMLPKGALRHPDGHNIGMLGVVKIFHECTGYHIGIIYPSFDNLRPGSSNIDDWIIPGDLSLEPSEGWLVDHVESGPELPDFSQYIIGLAANLLLVMMARSTLVTEGAALPRSKKTPSHIPHQWKPTWLGLGYRTRTESSNGESSAHYTELGWRCGHLKHQVCGVGRADRKVIWIEPYMARIRGLVAA